VLIELLEGTPQDYEANLVKLRWWRCEAKAEEGGVVVGECEKAKEGEEMMACGRVSHSLLPLTLRASLSSLTSLVSPRSANQSATALEVRFPSFFLSLSLSSLSYLLFFLKPD